MEARKLLIWFVGAWAVFAVATFAVSPAEVFHHLNAYAIAAGICVIVTYWPGVVDAWRQRGNNVTPEHLLALGIVGFVGGFEVRLARWYILPDTGLPALVGLPQWAYNVGLFGGILASGLVIAAVALSDPSWTTRRTLTMGVLFLAVSTILMIADVIYP